MNKNKLAEFADALPWAESQRAGLKSAQNEKGVPPAAVEGYALVSQRADELLLAAYQGLWIEDVAIMEKLGAFDSTRARLRQFGIYARW